MLLKDVLKNIEILEHKGNLYIDITNIYLDFNINQIYNYAVNEFFQIRR